MRYFRVSIDVDIKAMDLEQARSRLSLLVSDIASARRPWVVEILPDGIEERLPIKRRPS